MGQLEDLQREFKAISRRDPDALHAFYVKLLGDDREGVRKIAESARKAEEKSRLELQRLKEMRVYEETCEREGYTLICGIDEAGRGPLAGPVAAGAVILPKDAVIFGLNDSKKLTPKRREELYKEITEKAVTWGVGLISPQRIDEINILQADYEAMCEAIRKLSVMPQILLNDAVKIPQVRIPQVPIVKGDSKSVSIAAASILAKVTRDRLMDSYDKVYPQYGFAAHKGYGTAAHYEALKKYGPCSIHRMSFLKTLPEHLKAMDSLNGGD